MFYLIYQTTNLINGKVYIGKHQTKSLNDGYLGSGKLLKYAIQKYGEVSFQREILFCFESEEEMNDKEKELVTEDFCARKDNYNLCIGGQGGFSYINRVGLKPPTNHNQEVRDRISVGLTEYWQNDTHAEKHVDRAQRGRQTRKERGFVLTFSGKKHSKSSKAKMSAAARNKTAEQNSQFGSMWITNGAENMKIKKLAAIPEGFRKGRAISGTK